MVTNALLVNAPVQQHGAQEVVQRVHARPYQPRARRALTTRDFTPRQLDVLVLLCEGLPNKLIGSRLGISAGTVKIHVSHILVKLGASSRLQAVIAARASGLIG
jgi:DNA-binding NarL/FixJ family response regulator